MVSKEKHKTSLVKTHHKANVMCKAVHRKQRHLKINFRKRKNEKRELH